MEDKRTHNVKYNYNDLFLRNMIVGLRSFINNKLTIVYHSEEQGDYDFNIPFYFMMGADTQFVIDSFLDDIPGMRVESNTDVIPRATIGFETWAYNDEEFTNPTVWFTVPEMNEDEELVSLYRQIKWIPLTISGEFNFTVASLYEQFAIWQSFLESQYTYSYFTFEHKYITIQAYIHYASSTSNVQEFNKEFAHQDRIKLPFTFEIKTHMPVLDKDTRFNNKAAKFISYVNDHKNHNQSDIDFDKNDYE